MNAPRIAPLILGIGEDVTAVDHMAPTPAGISPQMVDGLAPPMSSDIIIQSNRLALATERYGNLLDEHASALAAGLRPNDAVLRRLVGLLDQARTALAKVSGLPREDNGDPLAKAVRRALSEPQQARHDDLMRVLERIRAGAKGSRR